MEPSEDSSRVAPVPLSEDQSSSSFGQRTTGGIAPTAVARMEAFLQLSQQGYDKAPLTRAAWAGATVGPCAVGEEIAGYEILAELGRGGMGVVYKARHKRLKRIVALKMIRAGELAGEEHIARFAAEAEAVAALQHPGIVQLFEIGEYEGYPFFSMEYVDGPSLAQQLARDLPPPKHAAALVARLADAVHFAHRRGIVHRDLKPANILLAESTADAGDTATYPGNSGSTPLGSNAKIADFGLAKQLQHDSGLTVSGAVMGTPSYMAPEQASGHLDAVGPATDVYSLGAVLYECLTGRPPFRAPSLADTLDQVRWSEPAAPSSLQAGVPRDLEVICLKCLRKNPGSRYASAADLAADLNAFLGGNVISARPVTRSERAWRWCKRNPAVAALVAICAVVLLAGSLGTAGYAIVAREKAREALNAQAEAEQSATDAIAARDRADASARDAVAATGRAEVASRDALHQLVRLHIASGSNAVEAGDLLMGLLWYEKARATDQMLGTPDAAHRTRIAGVLGRLAVWRACFFHPEAVLQFQWHPEARWIVTRTESPFLYLWDTANLTAEPIRLDSAARCTHFALSRDGGLLAACGHDGACTLWSVPEGGRRLAPMVHPQPVLWAAFHPWESRLVTACEDGQVRFWDTSSGREIGPSIAMPGPVSFVEFDTQGKYLLAATETNRVRAFDAATRKPTSPLVSHLRRHLRVAGEQYGSSVEPRFSPDGESFAGSWNGAFVRRTQGGEAVDTLDYPEQSVRRLEWSLDGQRLLVQSKTISRWWKPGNEQAASDRWLHPRESWVGAIHPKGQQVATASTAGKLHVWNPAAGTQIIEPIQHAGEILCIQYAPDGSCLAAAGTDGTLRLWEPVNRELDPQVVPDGEPDSFTRPAIASDHSRLDWVSKDGRYRMTARPDTRRVEVSRRATGEPLFDMPFLKKMTDAGFTHDSRLLYLRQADDVQVWDIEARRCVVERAPLMGNFVSVTSATTGNRALVIDDQSFQVFDLTTGKRLLGPVVQKARDPAEWGPAEVVGYRIGRGDISPDGARVVVPGGSYRVLRSYRVDSGTPLDVPLHDGFTYRAAFDRTGQRVLSAASDSTARVWEPSTGRPLAPPLRHNGFVRDAAYSDDGRTAATYCEAKERGVWLWDAETADLLLPPLSFPTRPLSARLYFSADGQRIVSLYEDGKDSRVVRWTIPRFPLPAEHIPALVNLITGRRMDDIAGPVPLRDEEVRAERKHYQAAFHAYNAARPRRK